jgi:hypothetical protein
MTHATTIFLASSSELKPEREAFETRVYRKGKLWRDQGITLDPVIWEDFVDAMSRTRSQDEYNKAICAADIFVLLVHTKVGKYSAEEFDVAHRQFMATGRPLIYTYFKNVPDPGDKAPGTDYDTVRAFIAKLAAMPNDPPQVGGAQGLRSGFVSGSAGRRMNVCDLPDVNGGVAVACDGHTTFSHFLINWPSRRAGGR